MAIDPSIILGARPVDIANPLAQYAQLQQLQAAQQQNRLQELMFADRQRQSAEDNALAELLSSGKKGGDLVAGLASKGYGNRALSMQKNLADQAKADADVAETKAKTQKTNIEIAAKRLDMLGQAFGAVRANPTLENASSAIDYLVQNGALEPQVGEQLKAGAAQNPASIGSYADQAFRAALSAKDQLPKFETRNLGATTETSEIDPVSGKIRVVSSVKNTVSPDAKLQSDTAIRGQNMADTRSRDANKIAQEGKVSTNSTSLRKEFDDLTEVKNYKQALPAYKAVADAASRNTTQSDINLVYGIAKLYDPTSVVREGEYATVANSPNIPERIKGYAQYLQGGGRLSPKVKQEILQEAAGRMGAFEESYSAKRKDYEDIARRSGADPTLVFPSAYESAIVKPPKKGDMQDGYRFKGGNPADPKNWEKM